MPTPFQNFAPIHAFHYQGRTMFRKTAETLNAAILQTFGVAYGALHRYASLSPVRLGCSALSGLCTRCANCGLTPMGGEISIGRSCTLTGSGGAKLSLFLLSMPKTFFFVQAVAREYRLVGDTGSLFGYGGAVADFGDAEWYDGKID